jgi:hypothetical protein
MILTHNFLRSQSGYFSNRQQQVFSENTQIQARKKAFDIFLSHSSFDRNEVLTLVQLFNKSGYSVYVDWLYDEQLDRNNVTPDTAQILRFRMKHSRGLSYLDTENASQSKWCPWELGYFDGKSGNSRCCILPVLSFATSTYHGQEYLGLYPYLEYSNQGSTNYDFWVREQGSLKYIRLDSWLNG